MLARSRLSKGAPVTLVIPSAAAGFSRIRFLRCHLSPISLTARTLTSRPGENERRPLPPAHIYTHAHTYVRGRRQCIEYKLRRQKESKPKGDDEREGESVSVVMASRLARRTRTAGRPTHSRRCQFYYTYTPLRDCSRMLISPLF